MATKGRTLAGPKPGDPPLVVGIGASAGGLSALRSLFTRIPDDSGLAFVVVVHLSSEHESHLADLLQPHVAIPVTQVTETVPLERNRVYVIPPGHNLSAIDTHLRLSELAEERRERAPIDHFFCTLARAHDGHAVGVILSGTGSDGTLGIKDIKTHGGVIVVQEPSDAEYDGMPQSAIATGLVDLVLPLEEIPDAVLRLATVQPDLPLIEEDDANQDEQRLFQKILAHVRARTGWNFNHYKPSTLGRRIRRRMQILQIDNLEGFLEILAEHPSEAEALADDLLITVTHFFRDPGTFEALESRVIPELLQAKGSSDALRVWSVGCATGEEAYSLAMLLLEALPRASDAPRIQVFASDLHGPSLDRARDGFYPGDVESAVTEERLRRFFTKERGGYRIRPEVRELVVFAPHDLLSDPPFSRLDLLVCRNVLIYLKRTMHRDLAGLFHYALNPEGYLVLGTSETLDSPDLFETVDKSLCLYRRRNVPSPDPRLPVFPITGEAISRETILGPSHPGSTAYGGLHERVVEQYAPPSVLINSDHQVVHFSERAGRYLVHPGGEPTLSLLKLVRTELRIELRGVLHAAARSGDPSRSAPVPMEIDGARRSVVLDARPMAGRRQEHPFVLVIFDERGPVGGAQNSAGPDIEISGQATTDLEGELEAARERLQGVIEEYETGQEEMKASNEELQSANEELRSTLEELETSKEELQSMNEELQTVNQENRHKVEELAQLSADLQNLMGATDIATLFLDRELRILRFTPRLADLFNIRPADRGRPIADLTHRLGYQSLMDDADRVLQRLVPIEREMRDDEGRWYLTRLGPYRSTEDRIEGVVITFVDITTRRESEEALRQSEERYRLLVEGAVEYALLMLDPGGHIVGWSSGAARMFGYDESEVMGRSATMLVADGGPDAGAEELRAARERGRISDDRLHVRKDGSPFWATTVVTSLRAREGEVRGFAKVLRDNTEERAAEAALDQLNREIEDRVEVRTRDARTQATHMRQLASRLTRAEQEERRRLARVLHDDLQQILYAIQMKVELAMGEAESGDPSGSTTRLGSVRPLLDQAIRTTRQLTVDVSPPVLKEEGLVDALGWLVTQMRDMHGLEVEVSAGDAFRLADEDMRVLLFHAVKELLFNVVKHAHARRAVVELDEEGDSIVIRVADEGRGFDVERVFGESGKADGYGLSDIRSRLALFQGRLEVESGEGTGGTRVTIYAPRLPEAPVGADEHQDPV